MVGPVKPPVMPLWLGEKNDVGEALVVMLPAVPAIVSGPTMPASYVSTPRLPVADCRNDAWLPLPVRISDLPSTAT